MRMPRINFKSSILLLLAGPIAALAQSGNMLDNKIVEPGFDPEQAYQVGNIDNINLFNGNLTLSVPLGPSYQIRDGFSYQFQLTYNSKIWRFIKCIKEPCEYDPSQPTSEVEYSEPNRTQAVPNPYNNAGAGWRLSLPFGELYGPTPDRPRGGFGYVDASGKGYDFRIHENERNTRDSQFKYPRYAFDGNRMLRFRVTKPALGEDGKEAEPLEAKLDLPDGTVLTYERPPDLGDAPLAPEGRWILVKVVDAFDNKIDLSETYQKVSFDFDRDGTQETVHVLKQWTITDPIGRSHTVNFDARGQVDDIDLTGFKDATSTYDFQYETFEGILRGCPHDRSDSRFASRLDVLDKIVQPDQESDFDFDYFPDGFEGDIICSKLEGRLRTVKLPTEGSIEYTYGPYGYPSPLACQENSAVRVQPPQFKNRLAVVSSGVTRKVVRDKNGNKIGQWEYKSSPAGWGGLHSPSTEPGDCEIADVVYTDVYVPIQGDRFRMTRHFFSAYKHGVEEQELGFDRTEYGVSIDRYSPDYNGGGRHRSSMTFRCEGIPVDNDGILLPNYTETPGWPEDRKHLIIPEQCGNLNNKLVGEEFDSPSEVRGMRERFVKYEGGSELLCDGLADDFRVACDNGNWRPIMERTYFWDRKGDSNPHFQDRNRTDFDGFGNYRTVSTHSLLGFGPRPEFPEDPDRIVTTDFNSHLPGLPGLDTPWVLTTFSRREVQLLRDAEVEGAFGLDFRPTAVTLFDFDITDGSLQERRQLRNGVEDGTDLIIKHEYSDKASGDPIGGHVVRTEYRGGDKGSNCPSAGRPQYEVRHQYQHGARSLSEFLDCAGNVVLRTLDREIDRNTGLPTKSWDISGIETRFDFDALWRLTEIRPQPVGGDEPAEAATFYDYRAADTGCPSGMATCRARVVMTRGAGSSIRQEWTFDGLGRIARKESSQPGATDSAKTFTYTPQSQIEKESVPFPSNEANGSAFVTYRYGIFGRPTRIMRPGDEIGEIHETQFIYADISRKTRIEKGLGTADGRPQITKFEMNGLGQLVGVSNHSVGPCDSGTVVCRDGWTVVDPKNGEPLRTKYLYDEGGRLELVEQRNLHRAGTSEFAQQVRKFEYDGAGLLTRESHPEIQPDTQYIEYGQYDALGNVGMKRFVPIDAGASNRFDVGFEYDRASRVTAINQLATGRPLVENFYTNLYINDTYKTDPYGPTAGNGKLYQSKRHNYDISGLDTVVTETNYYAGVGGRLSSRTLRTGGNGTIPRVYFGSGDELTHAYEYSRLGELTSISYPECGHVGCGDFAFSDGLAADSKAPNRDIEKMFTSGFLTGISDTVDGQSAALADVEYHTSGLISRIQHHNDPAIDDHSNDVSVNIDEDPNGLARPATITVTQNDGAELWSTGSYSYDGLSNVTQMGNDVFEYGHRFGRLVSANVEIDTNLLDERLYTYDSFGNLQNVESTDMGELAPTPTALRQSNRLSFGEFAYDLAGNLTDAFDYRYSYDSLSMMKRTERLNSASPVDFRYLYTADNERIAVIDSIANTERWTLRDPANRLIREFRLSSGEWSWNSDYVHRGSSSLARFVHPGGSEPIGRGAVQHLALDHLGTPRFVADGAGFEIAEHKYLPFGHEVTSPLNTDEQLKFTGHERDDTEPGSGQGFDLDYMHARFYAHRVTRFLSMDRKSGTAEDPLGWNMYTYAANRPMSLIDPDGRAPAEAVPAIGFQTRTQFLRHTVNTTAPPLASALFETFTGLELDKALAPASTKELIGMTIVGSINVGLNALPTKGVKLPKSKFVSIVNDAAGTNFTKINKITRVESPTSAVTLVSGTCGKNGGCSQFISEGANSLLVSALSSEKSQLGQDVLQVLLKESGKEAAKIKAAEAINELFDELIQSE